MVDRCMVKECIPWRTYLLVIDGNIPLEANVNELHFLCNWTGTDEEPMGFGLVVCTLVCLVLD